MANSSRTDGGTFGAFYDRAHFPVLNFGVDLRGVIVNSDTYSKVTSVTAGPRVVAHLPIVPIRPYAEGLLGGAHVQSGQGVAAQDTHSFAAGYAAGADLRILPWIDWRVLDYSYTRLLGSHTSQSSLTTGIVVRIPLT